MKSVFPQFPLARPLLLCAALIVAGCSGDDGLESLVFEQPETAVSYDVELSGMPSEETDQLAEGALSVFRLQDKGAQSPAFLKRRAQSDLEMVKKILRSRGYYAGEATVELEQVGDEAQDEQQWLVRINVNPGNAFTLTAHQLVVENPSGTAPSLDLAALGSPVGQQAIASDIVAAEVAAVDFLQRRGFPYASSGKRRAVADLAAETIEIRTPIATGSAATFGQVGFEGFKDVRSRYLRTYIPWSEGESFDLSDLRTYQQALLSTDLFDTVLVSPAPIPVDPIGPAPLPVTVTVAERPFQTVSAGAAYSTDEGPSVTGGYEHRNLFGENETLTLQAEIGVQIQRFGLGYREPQYQRNGQDLLGSLSVKREEDDAFDDITLTGTLGIERRLTPRWTVGVGGLAEAGFITDQGVDTQAYLVGVPTFAAYDGSDDLLNPTKGHRVRIEGTPYFGVFDDAVAGFLTLDSTASAYYDITGDKEYVLAGRGRIASILADDVSNVPPTRRLYSGGGGSVRGFAQRFVGPLDASNDPEGGLSAIEVGTEIRAKVYGDIGIVAFVDAGSVSQESFPDFSESVQFAAGGGFRYYSPAGPIRFDIAFPLNGRAADDSFQFYFSIGQAF